MIFFVLALLCILYAQYSDGFFVDYNDRKEHRERLQGHISQEILFNLYNFYYYVAGLAEDCDMPGWFEWQCDGLILYSSCTINPNCISYIRSIPNFRSTGCPKRSNSFAIGFLLHERLAAQCQTLYYFGPSDENSYYFQLLRNFHFTNFYNWHVQTISLLDHDYGNSVVRICRNIMINVVMNHMYKQETVGGMKVNFAWVEALIVSRTWFKCTYPYRYISCAFKCVDDPKRTCVDLYDRDGVISYEVCKRGWTAIVYNLVLYGESCNSFPKIDLENVKMWKCLYLDICIENTTLCTGWGNYCVISGNATGQCAIPKVVIRSNLYPDRINATHTHISPNEILSCNLFDEDLDRGLANISNGYWIHFDGTSTVTKTKNSRKAKNNLMQLLDHEVLFRNKINQFGYDYPIICLLTLAEGYLKIPRLINYTLIEIPTRIYIATKLYFYFLEPINFDYNGFPREMLFVDFSINDLYILNFSTSKEIEIPEKVFFGNVQFNITINLNPPDYVYYGYWETALHSVRAFRKFQWSESISNVLYVNDRIFCDVDMLGVFIIYIQILYGQSIIPSVNETRLKIGEMLPGVYKIVCILKLDNYNISFIRIKSFDFYVNPYKICILPYAPILGMLLKCVTNQFPKHQGSFTMKIYDTYSKIIVAQIAGNLLRIPYILLVERNYAVDCYFSVIIKNDTLNLSVSKPINIKSSLKVPSIESSLDCSSFGELPQEYDFFTTNKQKIVFYNKIFYLIPVLETTEQFCTIILLVTCVFQFPVIPYHIWVKKLSKKEANVRLVKSVEFLNKRNLIRNINEKATSKRNFNSKVDVTTLSRLDLFQGLKDDSMYSA